MSEKAYIRNPNGQAGGSGKFGTNEQDTEDFEQEKLIREWLEREGKSGAVELKHISRKGTARNTLLKASISLDQQIDSENGGRTFADIIAGPPGRTLEGGSDGEQAEDEVLSLESRLEQEIDLFFEAIGVTEETKTWAIRTLKLSVGLANYRSLMKDDEPWEISMTDLELEIL